MIARWHAVGFIDSFQTSLAKETAGNGESQANENREAQAATSPPNGPKCKFLKDLKNLFKRKNSAPTPSFHLSTLIGNAPKQNSMDSRSLCAGVHKVVAEHVADDHMPIFDAAHVRFCHPDLQVC